ncbi:hypothetical protein [Aliiruegeria sabulilitoris]|uniref:hypothetical protein n=1 Tax=Aliiruegeria sabulilitoris TaxID=1510458 RepID=UPI00082BE942|nr:hypothetical protein [Aliiruegeria sabulilitoris]NDR59618.1 hypothetical protein [Pseudoruegeria sp. M32A2M]
MTDTTSPSEDILATISPSAPRRILGIVVLCTLGASLVYLGIVKPPAELHWQVFLIGLGGLTLFLAEKLRRATENSLELTAEELRETTGRVVVRVEDVVAIERGAFAIKPSNGFLLRVSVSSPDGSHWAPGLWWRVGKRIGVGGITAAAETKTVAEILSALLMARVTDQLTDTSENEPGN